MTEVTQNEKSVLRALLTNDFTAHNGGIPAEYGRAIEWAVWSDCIEDAAEPPAVSGKALSGVCGSLVQKGLAGSDGECIWLTEAGFNVATA